jgi:hypothetical protein
MCRAVAVTCGVAVVWQEMDRLMRMADPSNTGVVSYATLRGLRCWMTQVRRPVTHPPATRVDGRSPNPCRRHIRTAWS